MDTLVGLIDAIVASASIRCAGLCCSSRDGLDTVVAAVQHKENTRVMFLHSDQTEVERADVLRRFQALCDEHAGDKSRLHILATTDFCTPASALSEEKPLSNLSLLINYDLPRRREVLARRLRGFLGAKTMGAGGGRDRTAASGNSPRKKPVSLYFVAANELASFRSVEAFTGGCIAELINCDGALFKHRVRVVGGGGGATETQRASSHPIPCLRNGRACPSTRVFPDIDIAITTDIAHSLARASYARIDSPPYDSYPQSSSSRAEELGL